jgi:hypothetical protein
MNQHKTKVIAIRVTQEQYDGLMCLKGDMKMGNYLYLSLLPTLNAGVAELNAERKKAEAKAKRQAKKEAAHGLQS